MVTEDAILTFWWIKQITKITKFNWRFSKSLSALLLSKSIMTHLFKYFKTIDLLKESFMDFALFEFNGQHTIL